MQDHNKIIIIGAFIMWHSISEIFLEKINFLPGESKSYKMLFSYFLTITGSLFSIALFFQFVEKEALHYFIIEDHFLEWLGFFILFLGFLFTSYFFIQIARREKKVFPLKGLTLFCLSAAFLFGAMEEISWGQRIFDIESGEFFKANNAQAETNFHNMVVGGVKLNKLIFGKLMFLFLLVHNIFWPLAVRKWSKIKAFHEKIGNFIPPWPQVVVFILAALMVKLVDHSRHNELQEVVGSLHYLVSVIAVFGLGFGLDNREKHKNEKLLVRVFGSIIYVVLLGLWVSFYIYDVLFAIVFYALAFPAIYFLNRYRAKSISLS